MRYAVIWTLIILGVVFGIFFIPTPSEAMTHKVIVQPNSKFLYAMATVLGHEGGLSNDKGDKGGVTNFGISLRFIKQTHLDINGDGVIDANDIIHLTKTEADTIYMLDWWKKYHYDEIEDTKVATKLFDSSVNMGASRAHKLVKMALNHLYKKQINVNANLDEKTIELINETEPVLILDQLRSEEEAFYREIVKRDKSQAKFLKGWLARASW